MLATVNIVTHEQVTSRFGDNLIALLLLILVRHLLEHMKKVGILPMNVSKNLHWCLKLVERLFVFEHFLSLLNQKLNHLNRKIHKWYRLGVLLSIMHDLIVQVVDEYIHYEGDLVVHVLLGYVCDGFFELFSPLLLDIQGLALVLLGFEVLIKESLKLLALVLLSQSLLLD